MSIFNHKKEHKNKKNYRFIMNRDSTFLSSSNMLTEYIQRKPTVKQTIFQSYFKDNQIKKGGEEMNHNNAFK